MKKFLSVVLAFMVLATACFVLAGCSKGDELEGTWKGSTVEDDPDYALGVTMKFDGKGKLTYSTDYSSEQSGTYTIEGDQLTISLDSWDNDQHFTFKITDNALDLTNSPDEYGNDYHLEKQ